MKKEKFGRPKNYTGEKLTFKEIVTGISFVLLSLALLVTLILITFIVFLGCAL